MADTFNVTLTVNYIAGRRDQNYSRQTTPAAQAQAKTIAGNPTIGFAAAELLAVGEITTLGECVFMNVDSTNFLYVGKLTAGPTFVPYAKIGPLQQAIFKPTCTPAELGAQSDTAACVLDYTLYAA